jgi:hypothetical protein
VQQLAKEAERGPAIPLWLYQDVDGDAVLVHRAPEVVLDAVDPDEYLIQVPLRAKGGPLSAQPCSIESATLLAPRPDRLTRQLNASLGHHFLDIAVAEGEAEVQPYAVLHHFDRKRCRR